MPSSLIHPERDVAYRWIRLGQLELIVPQRDNPDGKPWNNYLDDVALYDVRADPFETQNLAANPSQHANVDRLRVRLDDWWKPTP